MNNLFDLPQGQELKEKGMDLAADNRAQALASAKRLAIDIATRNPNRECCIDDVQKALINLGYVPGVLGMAAGSVFKGRRWIFSGRWVQTERSSSHARDIRVWILK